MFSLADLTEPLTGKVLVVAKKGETDPNKIWLEDKQNVEVLFLQWHMLILSTGKHEMWNGRVHDVGIKRTDELFQVLRCESTHSVWFLFI